MSHVPRAIIVVPCFNEANRLNLRAIQDFGRRTERVELLLVNDGSRDETLELLEHLEQANPRRFRCLDLERNRGKAEAVRHGVLHAIDSGAEYVGYWDADLATPLCDIEPFCQILDGKPQVEMVIGTRMRLLGHAIERHPLRHVLGRVFARTASLALGVRVFDTQCGAKLFRVTPRLGELFGRPFLARWIFDVEIMARLKLARRAAGLPPVGEAMYEFPLDAWRDVAGSSVKSSDFAKAIVEMAHIYWTYLRPGVRYDAVEADAEVSFPRAAESARDQKAA